jgi:hypothetical protein
MLNGDRRISSFKASNTLVSCVEDDLVERVLSTRVGAALTRPSVIELALTTGSGNR